MPIRRHNQAGIAQRYFATRGYAHTDAVLREVRLRRTLMITAPTCEIGKLVWLERETVHCLLPWAPLAAPGDINLLIPIDADHRSILDLFPAHRAPWLGQGN